MKATQGIVLFGTTEAYAAKPYYYGQQPINTALVDENGVRIFSSGKVERAVKEGRTVYLVSSAPQLPYAEWLIELLPHGHAFFTNNLFAVLNSGDAQKLRHCELAPWRLLFQKLGIEWSSDITCACKAKAKLIAEHGIIDGALLPGHTINVN